MTLHDALIKLGKELGYSEKLLEKGLCRGYVFMLLHAILLENIIQEKHSRPLGTHYKRLQSIRNIYAQNSSQSLSTITKEEHLDLRAYYEGIMLYLRPESYQDCFGTFVSQHNVPAIYALTKPTLLSEKEITVLLNKNGIFNQNTLTTYLNTLEKIIKNNLKEGKLIVPIFLNSENHSLLIWYDGSHWGFNDVNCPIIGNNKTSKEKLAQLIFESFSPKEHENPEHLKYVTLNTTIILDRDNKKFNFEKARDDFSTLDRDFFSLNQKKFFSLERNTFPDSSLEPTLLFNLLYLSCLNGDTDNIKKVLENSHSQIDINRLTSSNKTLLYAACQNNNLEAVKLLSQHPNIDPNQLNGSRQDTALYIACFFKHEKIVSFLLDHFHNTIEVNKVRKGGFTPLHTACTLKNLKIVELLLEHQKTNVNLKNDAGNTALHIASTNNDLAIIKRLLKHPGIDVNILNKNGDSPLHIACRRKDKEIISTFLEHVTQFFWKLSIIGIALFLPFSKLHVPSMLFCSWLHALKNLLHPKDSKFELYQSLVDAGTNILHKNCNQETVLDIAILNNNETAIRKLLEAGKNQNLRPCKLMSAKSLEEIRSWPQEKLGSELRSYIKHKYFFKYGHFFISTPDLGIGLLNPEDNTKQPAENLSLSKVS